MTAFLKSNNWKKKKKTKTREHTVRRALQFYD